ncbi:MAG: peptidylprolyl isomerase, partial [Burkholderiaceae bacterium]|nr:peptidylprolyl isomerase [Burkholderiaceae bacterium]
AYYESHLAAFEVPENAKVEFLVLSADMVSKQIQVSEADARAYYEQNKARYAVPEQRRASHILIKVDPGASEAARQAARSKAEAVLGQLRAGADFATLAKSESQDPGSASAGGDLGYFSADTMVKPFAEAAFALKPGETSGVVESEFGYHIIRLTGIHPGTQRSFESVRPEIESEIRAQQSSSRFAEAADTFSNLIYEQSDSLQPAAQRFGLTVQSADHVERSGDKDLPPESPLNNPRLLAALFSADSIASKRNTEAIDVGHNTLAAARIVEYRPVRRKPYDAVKDDVRQRYVQAQAQQLAAQAGEARLAALRGGEAASGFAAAHSVTRTATADFPAAAVESVFSAASDKLPAWVGADLGARGYAVYEIDKVVLPDEKHVAERRDAYRQQLNQAYGQQALADYVESARARAKVVTWPERLAPAQNR